MLRAAEILPLTEDEIPDWLTVARAKVWRKRRTDNMIERRRVLVPWFVYGWIINVQPFVAQMRADVEWCQSEGFQELLSLRHRTVDNFEQDYLLQYFFCRYIMQKMKPFHKQFDVVDIVHGPLPGSMDIDAPNHFMVRLYDNRTPQKDRMSEEVVKNIQRALKLRDPVWTARYGNLQWTDIPRTQP